MSDESLVSPVNQYTFEAEILWMVAIAENLINNALHNWPEHYVVQILRNQVPALRPSARLIITDGLALPGDGPGSGRSLLAERATRWNDLRMLIIFNAGERSKEDFARIVAEADSKFRINSIQHLWDLAANSQPIPRSSNPLPAARPLTLMI